MMRGGKIEVLLLCRNVFLDMMPKRLRNKTCAIAVESFLQSNAATSSDVKLLNSRHSNIIESAILYYSGLQP